MQDRRIRQDRELELLIAVSRPRRPVEFDVNALDWDRLCKLSELHGLLPLVWEAVRTRADGGWSRAIQREAEQYGKRQLKLSSVLLALSRAFRSEEIPLLPYKGPMLAQQFYGSLALRQSVDLDILVRPTDLRRAKEVLAGMGFHPTLQNTRTQEALLESSHCEAEFYSETADISVELHWAVLPVEFGVGLPSAAAFDESDSLTFCGTELRMATSEETILWLAAHATKHCWNRLIFLSDLARALDAPDLNFDRLMSRAKTARCESMLRFGVNLLRTVLDYVPSRFAQLSSNSTSPEQLQFVTTRLLAGDVIEPNAYDRHSLAISLMDNRARAARYCWNVVRNPQPADFETARLPRGLMFLYVPLRFARLAAKGMRSLLPSRGGQHTEVLPAKLECSD